MLEGVEIGVVAGPCRKPARTVCGDEVAHDIAVWIKDADFREDTGVNSLLSARLPKQSLRREYRCCPMVLAPQDGWLLRRIVIQPMSWGFIHRLRLPVLRHGDRDYATRREGQNTDSGNRPGSAEQVGHDSG